MAEKVSADEAREDAELMSRFSRIDSAIARDLEQRRRSRRIYWVLLGLTIAIGLAAVLFGPSQPTQVARAVVDDPQLREKLAAEPALGTAVAEAPAVQQQISQSARLAAVEAASSEAFAESLAVNPGFTNHVGAAALRAFEAAPEESGNRLRSLLGSDDALANEVRELAAEVVSLRDMLATMRDSRPSDGSLETRLDDIARRQAELAVAVEHQLELGAQLSARVDALTGVVAALEAQQVEKDRLGPAAGSEPLASLSYLLKENTDNPLAGVGLTVSLGRRNDSTIENVRVSDSGGVLFPDAAASSPAGMSIQLGEEFAFTDSSGSSYAAVFTYSQNRILWRDYVGLDLYRVHGEAGKPRD